MEFNRCYGCMEALAQYPCPHCGHTGEEVPLGYALRPGTILKGKYLIGKVLGQGGFGITYIGWDLALECKVAIKEYFPSGHLSRQSDTGRIQWYATENAKAAQSLGREMFLKEARKMSRVRSIYQVVQILDLFQDNDTAYICMEYVDGETMLKRLQKTGPLSWPEARALFLPVLEALEKVHEAGLIHRDLSPDNLMLQPDGQVKILDLGAAKDLNLNSGASSMQVAKGGFSPLEQYVQRGGSGTWTDVYAIAATLYYALTGVVPPSAIDRIDRESLRWDLPQLQQLPESVVRAMKKAMAIRHEDRTKTMKDFIRELTSPVQKAPEKPVQKPQAQSRPKARPSGGKTGKKPMLAAVLVLAVLAVAGLAFAMGGNDTGSRKGKQTQTSKGSGSVYYLNFKSEFDGALQELAKTYSAETGVEVQVVTPAHGTYGDVLASELDKVTVFNIGNLSALEAWGEYALDLKDSAIAKELVSNDFNLYNDDWELKAIGYCYESYGLIVNTELLASLGYTLADITDFASLKTVAEDITARSGSTGVYAFSDSGLEGSSSWRFSGHLANMPLFYEFRDNGITQPPETITGAYMDVYRNIWDLYIQNSAAKPASLSVSSLQTSQEQFISGKAVFYQNGTWEYSTLINAGMRREQLAMIPIYCGAAGEKMAGLCSGTESRWAVNALASPEDIQASMDFLVWLVSDPVASRTMVDCLGAVPFKNCPESSNKFIADGNALLEKGHYTVSWAFEFTPNVDAWRAGVVSALTHYSSGGSWEDVVTAFVDGWASQA